MWYEPRKLDAGHACRPRVSENILPVPLALSTSLDDWSALILFVANTRYTSNETGKSVRSRCATSATKTVQPNNRQPYEGLGDTIICYTVQAFGPIATIIPSLGLLPPSLLRPARSLCRYDIFRPLLLLLLFLRRKKIAASWSSGNGDDLKSTKIIRRLWDNALLCVKYSSNIRLWFRFANNRLMINIRDVNNATK